MTKISVYSSKGMKKSSTDLPKSLSDRVNWPLLAQSLRVFENKFHLGLSRTKTRSEVSVSTRKIYRQKGTGYARHGAKSAPIFVGGGITHGPKGVKRQLFLPKKMKESALKSALSLKAKEGKLLFIDGVDSLKKTSQAGDLMVKLVEKEKGLSAKSNFLVALSAKNSSASKVFRNLENVTTIPFSKLNAYFVYQAGVLLVDKDSLTEIGKMVKSKGQDVLESKAVTKRTKATVSDRTAKSMKRLKKGVRAKLKKGNKK